MCRRPAQRKLLGMTTLTDLKHTHRATWESGDYAAIAEHIDDVPPRDLLDRMDIRPGHAVLDVATGTGNVALRAAAAGADVLGLDLAPALFATARRRAAEYGVNVEWLEGDAEQLPFADETFDRVLSVFGVQFAPVTRWSPTSSPACAAPTGSSDWSTGPRRG
jgi:2-polyprenyl-3-methyl-5-hydroxy-6-metoxy-1,4-benzoquinol methylase